MLGYVWSGGMTKIVSLLTILAEETAASSAAYVGRPFGRVGRAA